MSEHGDLTAVREQAVSDAATLVSRARAESQQLLAAARADADEMRASAHQAAESIVARAEREAALIDERARQEVLWRRRQLRQEFLWRWHQLRQQQAELARWKKAIASQLASVSTLAVEAARDLYSVSEPSSGEDTTTDLTPVGEASQPAQSTPEATVQNNLSSALSSPRRAS
jgi:cell division septum initiation protein DivIVA